MRAVAQRVSSAEVRVDGERVSTMDKGLLAFVGVGREDDARQADELARRLLGGCETAGIDVVGVHRERDVDDAEGQKFPEAIGVRTHPGDQAAGLLA